MAGGTEGKLPGQASAGDIDAFLRKYNGAGKEVWTRQFGSGARDGAVALAADPQGNIYVAGGTFGELPGQVRAGQDDAFLRKYNGAGKEVWTRQFGTYTWDGARALAADPQGNIYVAGWTFGAFPGQVRAGQDDAFLRKYDGVGNEVWTRQFGLDADDRAEASTADPQGNIYVAGLTWGALPGQVSAGDIDAFVRKYDAAGNEVWTRQFGTDTGEYAMGSTADPQGNIYVAGLTWGALPGQASAGLEDAFVRKYDGAGNEVWTRQFGTTTGEYTVALAADLQGDIYVAGWTWGAFPGQASTGVEDAFVVKMGAAPTPAQPPAAVPRLLPWGMAALGGALFLLLLWFLVRRARPGKGASI